MQLSSSFIASVLCFHILPSTLAQTDISINAPPNLPSTSSSVAIWSSISSTGVPLLGTSTTGATWSGTSTADTTISTSTSCTSCEVTTLFGIDDEFVIPAVDGQTTSSRIKAYKAKDGSSIVFSVHRYLDFPSNNNPDMYDIETGKVVSLEDCMEWCIKRDWQYPDNTGAACAGMTYRSSGRFCWLKNGIHENSESATNGTATTAILHHLG